RNDEVHHVNDICWPWANYHPLDTNFHGRVPCNVKPPYSRNIHGGFEQLLGLLGLGSYTGSVLSQSMIAEKGASFRVDVPRTDRRSIRLPEYQGYLGDTGPGMSVFSVGTTKCDSEALPPASATMVPEPEVYRP